MKKVLLIIIILLVTGVLYYFIRIKNFNTSLSVYDEEKNKVYEYLSDINRPLTMLIISNLIDNQSNNITKNTNLLNDNKYKQQFTMEYYIYKTKNYTKFINLDQSGKVDNEVYPTDDAVSSYLKYNEFNKYYKKLFNKEFNKKDKVLSGYSEYDNKDYVYYINRRSGSNGVNIVDYNIISIVKMNKIYQVNIELEYSELLKERTKDNKLLIEYSYHKKDIILKSIEFI